MAVAVGRQALAGGKPVLPWKEYLLWGVLALGVLLIGSMSWALYHKLHGTRPGED